MTRNVVCTMLLAVLFLTLTSTCLGRIWTDRTGRQVEAELISVSDGYVKLKRTSDGKVFDLPLDKLSDNDQAFVKSQGTAGRRLLRLPLIIQQGVALSFFSQDRPEEVRAELAQACEIGPKAEIPAAVAAAKASGEIAGIEFEPVLVVEANQKPLDCLRLLPETAPDFLFIRTSAVHTGLQGRPDILCLGVRSDAALVRRAEVQVLHACHFLTVLHSLDPKKVKRKGDQIETSSVYWFEEARRALAEGGLGWDLLMPIQQRYMKDEIESAVAAIRAAPDAQPLTPTAKSIVAGTKLLVAFPGPGHCNVYLQRKAGEPFRRFTLQAGAKVDDLGYLEEGKLTCYAETFSDDVPTSRGFYRAEFTPNDKEEYTLAIPGTAAK